MSIKSITELKKQVEQAQQKADRARGSLDQLLKQLKDDFDCNDLEEAEKKLLKMESKLDKLREEKVKVEEEFEEEFGDK